MKKPKTKNRWQEKKSNRKNRRWRKGKIINKGGEDQRREEEKRRWTEGVDDTVMTQR